MSRDTRRRPRFMPELLRGRSPAEVNAGFRFEATQWGLRYRCEDCAYFRSTGRGCLVGWPSQGLRGTDDALDERGEPVFCKAFEGD
jgi:hypothetical protein